MRLTIGSLGRIGGIIVVALSISVLLLFQSLSQSKVADGVTPSQTLYNEALKAYSAQEFERAHELFLAAAQQGNADSKSMLGVHYFNGHGVPQDKVKAAIWFYQAAEAGRPAAQLVLGKLYLAGDGVGLDKRQGAFWLMLASARGDEKIKSAAQSTLETVLSQLNAKTVQKLRSDVDVWRPNQPEQDTLG